MRYDNKSETFNVLETEQKSLHYTFLLLKTRINNLKPLKVSHQHKEELEFLLIFYQKQLTFHFTIEKNLGVLKNVSDTDSNFKGELANIQNDNRDLLLYLKELSELVKNEDLHKPGTISCLQQKFEDFIKHLTLHEEWETDIIMKATETDDGYDD